MEKVCNFGEHLTLDGYDGNFDLLNNKELVLDCLNNLPKALGMRKLAEPEVYEAPDADNNKDSGGWSGFVVIAESHISIHTFPYRRFVSIDIYTCKQGMNQDFVVNYFIERFKLENTEVNFIKRGTKFPVNDID